MQGPLAAGWPAFTGEGVYPLDRDERFQITFFRPPFLDVPDATKAASRHGRGHRLGQNRVPTQVRSGFHKGSDVCRRAPPKSSPGTYWRVTLPPRYPGAADIMQRLVWARARPGRLGAECLLFAPSWSFEPMQSAEQLPELLPK